MSVFEEVRKTMEYCTYCPKMCRFSCPVEAVEHRETVTPTAKQTTAFLVREGAIPLDAESVAIFFKCTGCLHCRHYCLHDNDVPRSLESARTHAFMEGQTLPVVVEASERFRKFGNPHGRALLPGLKERLDSRYFRDEAAVLLFPGADLAGSRPDLLARMLKVLEALGVEDIALPNKEIYAAGMELLDLGDRPAFTEHAQRLRRVLDGYGLVISPSPHDAHCLLNRYGEFGQGLGEKYAGFPEFLLQRLDESGAKLRSLNREVVWHDPCTLARRLKSLEAPREILGRCGVRVKEPMWSGLDTNCCGAGGAYAEVFPEEGAQMARLRLDELAGHGGGEIVTASPRCEEHMRAAARSEKLAIVDLIEILAESLGVETPRKRSKKR